jgi:hypothetical protein
MYSDSAQSAAGQAGSFYSSVNGKATALAVSVIVTLATELLAL